LLCHVVDADLMKNGRCADQVLLSAVVVIIVNDNICGAVIVAPGTATARVRSIHLMNIALALGGWQPLDQAG